MDDKKAYSKAYKTLSESKNIDWNIVLDYIKDIGDPFEQDVVDAIEEIYGQTEAHNAGAFLLYCYSQIMPKYLSEAELDSVNRWYKIRYAPIIRPGRKYHDHFGFLHTLWDLCDTDRLTQEELREHGLRSIRCPSVENITHDVTYCFIKGFLEKYSLSKQQVLVARLLDTYN